MKQKMGISRAEAALLVWGCLCFCFLAPVSFLSSKLVLSLPGQYGLKIPVDLCECGRRVSACINTLPAHRASLEVYLSLPFALPTPWLCMCCFYRLSACSTSAKQSPVRGGESRSDSIKSAVSPQCSSVLPSERTCRDPRDSYQTGA